MLPFARLDMKAGLRIGGSTVVIALFGWIAVAAAAEPSPAAPPSKEAIALLLAEEPPSLDTWPVWRKRYLRWYFDHSGATNEMDDALQSFIGERLSPAGDAVAPPLDDDPVAWSLFSRFLFDTLADRDRAEAIRRAEAAAKRAVELAPDSAPVQSTLASQLVFNLLMVPEDSDPAVRQRRRTDAEAAIAATSRLSPDYRSAALQGLLAFDGHDFARARKLLQQGTEDHPRNQTIACFYLQALIADRVDRGALEPYSAPVVSRFPDNGALLALHAVALARDGRFPAAAEALGRARATGMSPENVIGDETVRTIERLVQPSWPERLVWGAGFFVAFYALIMAAMALGGVVLSALTPRVPAANVAGEAVRGGIAISDHESWLARLYMLALIGGIVLFYLSVPFVAAGLVAATGAALLLVLQLPRIPVKLLALIAVVGLGMAWAVIRSIFASHGRSHFGLPKTAAEAPRLFAALGDVAARTMSRPIENVFLTPGSDIGVYQDGRGPFGMFGVKRRVLSLGLATIESLTIDEFKSILAHEYAHFSHRDTFYSRFIQQVAISISTALGGMGAAGGSFNYVNPFFWFFWLYYHAYSLLSCGFSRSREFLADRMAVSLYGRSTFESALTKVAVEGTLFQATIYPAVASLLMEGKALENIYETFRKLNGEQITTSDREQLRQSLQERKSAWFATHPTIPERFRAIEPFPDIPPVEPQSALDLFDDVPGLEKSLTDYLTGHAANGTAA